MGVVSVKSTLIGNRDATPVVLTNASIGNGRLQEATGYVSATNGDSATSKYILAQVPSNARLSSLILQCAALGAGAALDCGVFRSTADGGAAVSAALFASAIDAHLALGPTEILNQSGSMTIDKQEQPLWQAAGMASDPSAMLDIVVVVNVAIAATGLVGLKARYVVE